MANENGGGLRTIGIVAIVLAGIYVLVSLIKGVWNPAKWFVSAPQPNAYDKCVADNKAKKDGDPCTSCVDTANGQTGTPFQGTIVNGACTKTTTTQSYQIKITKQPSAQVYTRDASGNFVSPVIPKTIAFGTVLGVIGVDKNPASYYNTTAGWISANDSAVIIASANR